jgi:hypothetical protein
MAVCVCYPQIIKTVAIIMILQDLKSLRDSVSDRLCVLRLNYYNYHHNKTVNTFLTLWFVLLAIKSLPLMSG